MNNFKTTLKFNKKVYIVPVEKLSNLKDMERMSKQVQENESLSKGIHNYENEPGQEVSENLDRDVDLTEPSLNDNTASTTFSTFKNKLTQQQYNNIMAIAHMINLNPETSEKDRESLLFTQNLQHLQKTPANIADLYHMIDNAKVPRYLITNGTMRRALDKMATLQEPVTDSDSSSLSSVDEDESDTLKRAWIYYARNRDKKRRLLKKEREIQKKKRNKEEKKKKKKKHPAAKSEVMAEVIVKSTQEPSVAKSMRGENRVKDSTNQIVDWVHLF
jgi:hypothetical protein